MNTWTSSLTYRQLRTWLSRLILQSSSTYTIGHVLLWVQIVTTCSRGKQLSGWTNQRQRPTEGAAAQQSPRAYLQTRDWMLLQSMSLDPSHYGRTVGAHGYEPILTLDPMAPEELLGFTTRNCNGDWSNQWCSCKENGVKCISACGNYKGVTCKNCAHDGVESMEGSDIESLHFLNIWQFVAVCIQILLFN